MSAEAVWILAERLSGEHIAQLYSSEAAPLSRFTCSPRRLKPSRPIGRIAEKLGSEPEAKSFDLRCRWACCHRIRSGVRRVARAHSGCVLGSYQRIIAPRAVQSRNITDNARITWLGPR